MKQNQNLLSFANLIKFYRWIYVGFYAVVVILLGYFFWKTTSVEARDNLYIYIFLGTYLVVVLAFVLMAYPGMSFFLQLEKLLKGITNEPALKLGTRPEIKKIRIALALQMIINLILFFVVDLTKGDFASQCAQYSAAKLQDSTGLLILFENQVWVLSFLSWVYVPLDLIMPILYWIILKHFISMEERNRELANELEEIV